MFREDQYGFGKENLSSKISESLWQMFAWSSNAFRIGKVYRPRKASSRIFSSFTMAFILIVTWAYR
jgi:hypothetical protein